MGISPPGLMSKWTKLDAIGGYPSLELNPGSRMHENAIRLNSARNGFEYVLTASHYRRVFLPFYTCSAMFEAPRKLGVDICFYRIGLDLEPEDAPALGPDEAYVYTNYFGLKQDCAARLFERYGNRLIMDNSQAFYARPLPGVDTFYSPRKFFGVPDGGLLYSDKKLPDQLPRAESAERFLHLIKRIESGAEAGYDDFRNAEKTLDLAPLQAMSQLTDSLLGAIDYERAAWIRRENFRILHEALGGLNRIHPRMDGDAVPMVYPFLTDDPCLRQRLIANRVFLATYWPNVKESTTPETIEYELADRFIPLPVDQRYGPEEMERIIQIILG